MTEISISYGVVLYELGVAEPVVLQTEEIFRQVPEVGEVLANPTIPMESKHMVIEKVFPGEIHNFLKKLCDYHHIQNAAEVFAAYHEHKNEKEGTLCASLAYVTEPDALQQERIKSILCKKYGCKRVILTLIPTPELLGGFIIKVGNREIDFSIRGRMQQLKINMIRR